MADIGLRESRVRGDSAFGRDAVLLAIVVFLIHLAGNPHYGFFRDELYFIECGRYPAWGYVDQPPLVPLMAAASQLGGLSLAALRGVSALFAGASAFVVCVLAAEMGGGRFAVVLAALASALAPVLATFGMLVAPDTVQLLMWPLGILCVVRALDRDPAWWLAAGLVLGVAGEAKYSAVILAAALVFGIVCTGRRGALVSPFLAGGVAIAVVVLLPNFVWQWRHDWPMSQVLEAGQHGKNVLLSPGQFLWQQVMLTHPVLAPVWILGLAWCVWRERFRWLGLGACALLAAMIVLHGKAYYPAALYPALFAAGGVAVEGLTARRVVLRPVLLGVVVVFGVALLPMSLPVLAEPAQLAYTRVLSRLGVVPIENERHRSSPLGQVFADMHGWHELADQVAGIVRGLPPEDRADVRVFAANYGEAAAVDVLAPAGLLPRVLSGHNQYWVWGPGDFDGRVVLDVGGKVDEDRAICGSAEVVGVFGGDWVMPGEDGREIVLCRGLRVSVGELWRGVKHFE